MKHIFWMAYNASSLFEERTADDYILHVNDVGIRRTFARDASTPTQLITHDGFVSLPMQAERVS